MTQLASLLTHVFFRHVEVEGADNLPARGPLVVLANHSNGLVDGLLLMTTLRRYPRFLGKSTLFRILPLRPFLKLAGVVPVYRRSDASAGHDGRDGLDPERNEASFRTSRELLARGGVVAVFPEGVSHNEPELQPLRTGAARIALSAADEGTVTVATVAVGLVYDAKATFRSRALVRVGPPSPVAPWLSDYRDDPRDTVRRLTDDMATQLHGVVSTYRSWQEAEVLAGIADLVVAPVGRAPSGTPDEDPPTLADRDRVAARLATLDLDATPGGAAMVDAYQAYRRDLVLMGLTDAQVTARYGWRCQRALAWSLFKVAAALPPGVVGAVVHAVPYQVVKAAAKLPRNESIRSTVKLVGCFFLFSAEYLVIAEVVRRRRGVVAGACALVAAPLSGYAALRLSERVKSAGGLIEGGRIVGSRRTQLPTVLAHRAEVVRLARTVVGGTTSTE